MQEKRWNKWTFPVPEGCINLPASNFNPTARRHQQLLVLAFELHQVLFNLAIQRKKGFFFLPFPFVEWEEYVMGLLHLWMSCNLVLVYLIVKALCFYAWICHYLAMKRIALTSLAFPNLDAIEGVINKAALTHLLSTCFVRRRIRASFKTWFSNHNSANQKNWLVIDFWIHECQSLWNETHMIRVA